MATRAQETSRLNVFFPVLLAGILTAGLQTARAQEKPQPLIKAGYLPSAFSEYYGDDYLLHLEYERNFKRPVCLSHGFGYNFQHYGHYERFNVVRYNLRFYPLFWLYKKKPYRGLYLGISPAFHWRNFYDTGTLSGFGIMPHGGFQFLIRDKVSLAFDMNMYAYRDFREEPSNPSGNHFYFTFYYSFKVGLKLGGSKK